ncbi:hypothetical protein V8E55_005834 [Tylopilus felleus]
MHGSLSFQVVGKIVGSPAVPSPIDFPDPLRTDLDEMGMVHPETSWRCWSPVLTYNTFRDSEERERPTRYKTVFMRRFWVPLLTYTLISCRIIDMLSSLDVLLNDSKGQEQDHDLLCPAVSMFTPRMNGAGCHSASDRPSAESHTWLGVSTDATFISCFCMSYFRALESAVPHIRAISEFHQFFPFLFRDVGPCGEISQTCHKETLCNPRNDLVGMHDRSGDIALCGCLQHKEARRLIVTKIRLEITLLAFAEDDPPGSRTVRVLARGGSSAQLNARFMIIGRRRYVSDTRAFMMDGTIPRSDHSSRVEGSLEMRIAQICDTILRAAAIKKPYGGRPEEASHSGSTKGTTSTGTCTGNGGNGGNSAGGR